MAEGRAAQEEERAHRDERDRVGLLVRRTGPGATKAHTWYRMKGAATKMPTKKAIFMYSDQRLRRARW